jgi:hypothetical protein
MALLSPPSHRTQPTHTNPRKGVNNIMATTPRNGRAKAAPKAAAVTVEMDFLRETKNTYVFSTVDEEAAVTTLYVNKSAFGDEAPAKLTLALTPA